MRSGTESELDGATFSKMAPSASHNADSDHVAMLLTDSQGTILGFNQAAASGNWTTGQKVKWRSDRGPSPSDDQRFGRIATALGERTSILYPVKGLDRQVIVYSPTAIVPSWKTSLQASIPVASGLGFFWTLSLSVVATIVITSRSNFNATKRQAELDHDALRNAQDLLRTRDAVIFGLAKLAESRDAETGHHLERISLYTTRLATALRPYPKYQRIVSPTFVRLLGISSVLHDIGKVGIEDTVLLKPGKLTEDEYRLMQQHTLVAGDCLREIEERLGASNFLQTAREIAVHHHERWDGMGYPHRLAGEAIPLAARIVAIADVYDALSSKRIYKEAYPHQQCVDAIRSGAGTQFDPELVEVFLEIESEFAAISGRFARGATEGSIQNPIPENKPADGIMSDSDSKLLESVVGEKQSTEDPSIVSVA